MVSIEFASITIGLLLSYIFLYYHETRWIRMVGCFLILLVSVSLGVIADTIPLFILMTVNMLIAFLKLIEEVGELIGAI